MAVVNEVERSEYIGTGGEREIIWVMLDFYRDTLLAKCQGLDEEQLKRRSVPPSTLTLLGLVRHMTENERYWFEECLLGRDLPPMYATDDSHDGEFNDLDSTSAEEVVKRFLAVRDSSRRIVAVHSLDEVAPRSDFGPVSLRFIGMHLVDEYARHCGHADLLRQAIDGAVGR
jgi:uncharacterized damage-inducible protein DinB